MRTLNFAVLALLGACASYTPAPAPTVEGSATPPPPACATEDQRTFYDDRDGDGYGDSERPIQACSPPAGAVEDATDCDDARAEVNPGATELCDGLDNDCDGADDDDAVDAPTWYADADGDGFGDLDAPVAACLRPAGTVADATDCDDASNLVWPGAPEVCDGADDDCDLQVDEGVLLAFHPDADGDGFGYDGSSVLACAAPAGTVQDDTDCDDTRAESHPGAPEMCDLHDNDCDLSIDEGVQTEWHADVDRDGFGNPSGGVFACTAPFGRVADASDCDDLAVAVHPGAVEVCNGVDDDCDLAVDEEAIDQTVFYGDGDGDGAGDPGAPVAQCFVGPGTAVDPTDCDDANPAIGPSAPELCNGLDDDCDGTVDLLAVDATHWHVDLDLDGYGGAVDAGVACSPQPGWIADGSDCDDADASVSPAADEICGGVDEDCSGAGDDGAVDAPTWYADSDGDGYGGPDATVSACVLPAGYAASNTDCDDTKLAVNPGEPLDECGNGDDDCDGTTDEDCYVDVCGTVSIATLWTAPQVRVTCDISVVAALTIGPGTTVFFEPGTSLAVTGNGSLDAGGVLFTAFGDPGSWGGISLANPAKESLNDLDGATIFGAGEAGSPALLLDGVSTDIDLLTVSDNAGPGLQTDDYDGLLTDLGSWRNDGPGIACATIPCWGGLVGAVVGENHGVLVELPPEGLFTYAADLASTQYFADDLDAIRVIGGQVSTSTTWSLRSPFLRVGGPVTVGNALGMTLTIADGSRLEFEPGASLAVGGSTTPADLVVDGAIDGVVMTSASATPLAGDWDYLEVDDDGIIDGLTVEYAGGNGNPGVVLSGSLDLTDSAILDSAGVGLSAAGALSMQRTAVQRSGGDGVTLTENSTLSGLFADNTVTDNGGCGLVVRSIEISSVDPSSSFVRNGTAGVCVQAPGVFANTDGTYVWHGLDANYLLLENLTYNGTNPAPLVTFEDGADVDLGGHLFYLGGIGGDADVTIAGDPAGEGVTFSNGALLFNGEGPASITGATFLDAGVDTDLTDPVISDCTFSGGSIVELGTNSFVSMYRTTMIGSGGTPVNFDGVGGGWVDFDSNTFLDWGQVELPIWIIVQHDDDSHFCDPLPGQWLQVSGVVNDVVTLDSAQDCPLLIDSLQVRDGGDLTIEPQTVSMLYALYVGLSGTGVLRADGVDFRSVDPLATFDNLWFGAGSAGSSLVGGSVAHGGAGAGGPNNTGEVYCDNCTLDLTDASITDSASYGLFRVGATNVTLTGTVFANNATGNIH